MKRTTTVLIISLILTGCPKENPKIEQFSVFKKNQIIVPPTSTRTRYVPDEDFVKIPPGIYHEICNGYDLDGDGLYFCDDPDCRTFELCNPGKGKWEHEIDCKDKVDNDGDGAVDMEDADCKYTILGHYFRQGKLYKLRQGKVYKGTQ